MNKLQVMQTENTFSNPSFNFSNCNVTINYHGGGHLSGLGGQKSGGKRGHLSGKKVDI